MVDHEDSFVHTLANYLRQLNAEVLTCRSGPALDRFVAEHILAADSAERDLFRPDLVVLSPGPGSPSTFQLSRTIRTMIGARLPIFGVCLGLQGIVEYFGGRLSTLDLPMHGKPSIVRRRPMDSDADILSGLPDEFQVARYHSLYADLSAFPHAELKITSSVVPEDDRESEVVMSVQHRRLPIAAVQFHPESILTLQKHGLRIIENALQLQASDYDNNNGVQQ